MKNEALNAFSSLRFHLEENGAKYFQLSSLMRFQKYLFSVSSDDVSVFHFDAFSPPGGGGTAIYGLYAWVCAAVKGMVFKQFTLG